MTRISPITSTSGAYSVASFAAKVSSMIMCSIGRFESLKGSQICIRNVLCPVRALGSKRRRGPPQADVTERGGVEEELIRRNHSVTTSLIGRFGEFQRLEHDADVDERREADTTKPSGGGVQVEVVERGNDTVSSNMGMERTIDTPMTTITPIRMHLKCLVARS
jgi:hypothetical protein